MGDIHLRDTQYATSQRSGDFFAALERAVHAADKAGADCICCCGDNFDVSRPSAKTIGQMMQVDQMLRAKRLTMFAITGNHDYSAPTWLSTLFPGRGPDDVGVVPIDGRTVDFRGFRITGIPPYTAKTFREKQAEIEILTRDADVVLYHGFVTGIVDAFVGDKHPLDVADLPVSKNTKALLLGDIHVQGYTSRDRPGGGKTLTGYPGSLEMCSKSEPTEKSVPMIRVSKTEAVVEKLVPLRIRPHFARTVRTPEDLDKLIAEVAPVADQHPVVLVEFDRSLPHTVTRLHGVLDPQRCVIRCYALPAENFQTARVEWEPDGSAQLDMAHFVTKRFDGGEEVELLDVALALLTRGDKDANNIVSEFVQKRMDSMEIREDVA